MTDWNDYFYPGTDVLRNKLGIQDKEELERAERRFYEQRLRQGCPQGDFDLAHLQDIHRHLFQDVYEWAGELREVDMFKSAAREFQPADRIAIAVQRVHELAVKADFLRNMNVWEFSDKAAQIVGDINQAHPFREGNGRTQFEYLEQLGGRAGHNVDTTRIDRAAWIEASIEASRGNYGAMNDQIRAAIVPTLEKTPLAGKLAPEAESVKRQEVQKSAAHVVGTPEWEAVREAELNRHAIERQNQTKGQQEALGDILEEARRKGKPDVEVEERRRTVEKVHHEQQEKLAREQQERLDRLELLYGRGLAVERER